MELIQYFVNKIQGHDKNEFLKKVREVSAKLLINPNWLLAVMNSESGFSASIINQNGGATGLIQFMPKTAQWLGTSTQALRRMSRVDQLDWVKKYYQKNIQAGYKIESYEDLYLITFYPLALKKGEDYIFGSERGDDYARLVAKVNPFDYNHDGYIDKQEFRKFIYRSKVSGKIPKSEQKKLFLKPGSKIPWGIGAIAFVMSIIALKKVL